MAGERKEKKDNFLLIVLIASAVLLGLVAVVGSSNHPNEGEAERTEGFWGKITANVDWCEENYAVTYYVAEFWNTISNIYYIIFGVLLLVWHPEAELRYKVLYVSFIVLGVGSALFHGSLLFAFQLCDEIPMFIVTLALLYIAEEHYTIEPKSKIMPYVYVIGMTIFTIVYIKYQFATFFQLSYGLLTIYTVRKLVIMTATVPSEDRIVMQAAVYVMLTSLALWILEQALCSPMIRLIRLHAMWHLGTAYACYCAGAGTLFIRYRNILKKPNTRYVKRLFILPSVVYSEDPPLPHRD